MKLDNELFECLIAIQRYHPNGDIRTMSQELFTLINNLFPDLQETLKPQCGVPQKTTPVTFFSKATNNSVQAGTPETESTNVDNDLDMDLGLDLDDFNADDSSETQSKVSSLPPISIFWPNCSAQYWVPSRQSLYSPLVKVLIKNDTFCPSDRVPLLFFNNKHGKDICVLSFENPQKPIVRPCLVSPEDELYNKRLPDHRLLLMPSDKVPDGKLVLLSLAEENIGTIESLNDLSWTLEFIPLGNERMFFLEDCNTPSALRQSKLLREVEQNGHLYIAQYFDGEAMKDARNTTDKNSPLVAARKNFAKQAETLCPYTWRESFLGKEADKKLLKFVTQELFSQEDEAGLYILRNFKFENKQKNEFAGFTSVPEMMVSASIKYRYLAYLKYIMADFKAQPQCLDSKTDKAELFKLKTALVEFIYKHYNELNPDTITEKQSQQKPFLPQNPQALLFFRACLTILAYNTADKICQNFMDNLHRIRTSIQYMSYEEGKNQLMRYVPNYEKMYSELLKKMLANLRIIQSCVWEYSRKFTQCSTK